MDLRSDRQMGFGEAGRIMFTSIHEYAERYGIECLDEFDTFASLVRALDTAYLKHKPAPEPAVGKKPE